MKQDDKQSPGRYWQTQISEADESFKSWVKRGKKIVARYRDERNTAENKKRKFNILWANVQVLKPALYGKKAKPQASRRYKDKDPVSRTAALILERCLEYEVEQYPDFDAAMSGAVEDRLLPGRGTSWIRYEPQIVTEPQITGSIDGQIEHLEYECAPCDYVYWDDFLHNPARTWDEVWWVARRVYLDKTEGTERFGDIFKNVPIETSETDKDSNVQKDALKKKAQVYEIWDKTNSKVYWIAKDYDEILDERDDPLELPDFFPCPKPLFATTTTGSLVPVPDYAEYQDQAEELDILTQRISMLTHALKVVGVYNREYKELQRLLNEGVDNNMIGVDAWAAFSEKGGMKGAVEFLPIQDVLVVLQGLMEAREVVKQSIYEIMGISDIIRGSSDPNETLGAQELKANYGSLRLRDVQKDVAVFATEILRQKAHIMTKFFRDETLIEMSGIQYTDDAQYIPQALQLLRSQLKTFRISVESDSLAQLDENKEKADRLEFLSATGAFLKEAIPVIQSNPGAGPLLGEMLLFGVRGFKVGNSIEGQFEAAIEKMSQAPQIPPQMQEQMQMMQEQLQKLSEENQKLKSGEQVKMLELQASQQRDNLEMAGEQRKQQFEAAQMEKKLQFEMQAKAAEIQATKELEMFKAKLQQETEIKKAEIAANSQRQVATISADQKDKAAGVPQTIKAVESKDKQMEKLVEMQGEILKVVAKPRRRRGVRGSDGKLAEVIEEILD